MFAEYIQAALEKTQYKLIDNGDEPYFVDSPNWTEYGLRAKL
jgi:hypothetical protein